ncbi:ABC transporter permease [Terrihabitans rhizophilus]|uniref:ABC transporter permease n=1 Tax=Terrihabitans rhizophilus TaxID=3092662 RepID=UPI0029DE860C|nr:ABC transporter permease [Terrihabitans sp. PJ23]
MTALPLSLRLALRELRGGLTGFRIFVACLALGVAAIAGIGSVARGLNDGLSREGRAILGGDASFSLVHREASPDELLFLKGQGTVSTVATLRSMVRAESGEAALAELKAVDDVYPLAGSLVTNPPRPLAELLGERNGFYGAVVDSAMLGRLNIEPGARIRLGSIDIEIRAELSTEPDALSDGIGLGPRVFVSRDALAASGLITPGSLVRWNYRVAVPEDVDPDGVVERANEQFPQAGWRARTRDNASERLTRNIALFSQFLTLVGLTALLVGGVGVANSVSAYVERKRETIAVLKCMGAPGRQVFGIYLAQILLISVLGITIGLLIGAALPFVVDWAFAAFVPLPFEPGLEVGQLGIAAAFGLLVAMLFAVWPLGRAHELPVSALFRDHVAEGGSRWPKPLYIVLTGTILVALLVLTVAASFDRRVAIAFLVAAAGTLALLRVVAFGLAALARRAPRPRTATARLALANIHRPGALTPSVVLSLGLGIALLVTVTLIDSSIRHQLASSLPERAPSFFFIDIPNTDAPAFTAFLRDQAPKGEITEVPMLRGRITQLKGQSTENYPAGEAEWVLRGDRGLTFSDTLPEGSQITAGTWWDAGHTGDNLVSFETDLGRELGLQVGDTMVVNVLGREITARIANFRTVDWENLGINFVMVFSPNSFAGAPYQTLATLTLADGAETAERALLREAAAQFPNIISVRVKDALATIADLAGKLVLGIRAASGITILASVLVLAGALAAGHRYRLYDAMILKTLGGTRRQILTAFTLEYLLIGAASGLVGLLAGALSAWVVVTRLMKMEFHADPLATGLVTLLAVVVTVALGLAGTWRLARLKPARVLRDL